MHNRLPPAQVFIEFLNLYTTYKENEWHTFGQKVKYAWESLIAYGKKILKALHIETNPKPPVYDQIITSINHFKDAFENASKQNDVKVWIDLIFDLRKHANEAQDNKYINLIKWASIRQKEEYVKGTSLLKDTLHGLADLIILYLNDNAEFQAFKKGLLEDKEKFKKQCNENTTKANGAYSPQSNLDLSITILKLAIIGDIDSCNEAYYRPSLDDPYNGTPLPAEYPMPTKTDSPTLLGHLKLPNDAILEAFKSAKDNHLATLPENLPKINRSAPMELQPHFINWLYAYKYQTINNIDLKTFLQNAVKKGEKIAELEKKKQESSGIVSEVENDTSASDLPTQISNHEQDETEENDSVEQQPTEKNVTSDVPEPKASSPTPSVKNSPMLSRKNSPAMFSPPSEPLAPHSDEQKETQTATAKP